MAPTFKNHLLCTLDHTLKLVHELSEEYLLFLLISCLKLVHATYFLLVTVAECKIASLTGVQGIMVRETSETFGIITRDDKFRGIHHMLAFKTSHQYIFMINVQNLWSPQRLNLVCLLNLIQLYRRSSLSSSSNSTAGNLHYLETSLLQETIFFSVDAKTKARCIFFVASSRKQPPLMTTEFHQDFA